MNMLDNLKDELMTAASDTKLPTERRELALTLLEFLSVAPNSYQFEAGDYDPEVEALLRPARAYTEAHARWYIPQTFTHCSTLVLATAPQETAFEEIF